MDGSCEELRGNLSSSPENSVVVEGQSVKEVDREFRSYNCYYCVTIYFAVVVIFAII